MKELLSKFKIELPEGIYIKDPESSKLGIKIIENSIVLIENMGFEDFNFKKLGKHIGTNESSIYRYFENKHNLLLYLTSWYWSWIEYQLVIETYSISNPEDKLKKAIEVLTRITKQDSNYSHINQMLLNKIVIYENSKSYLTKNVDAENKDGFFMPYKRVVHRFSGIISDYNTDYKYPLSLASSIVEGALQEHFVKTHFKSITNCNDEHLLTEFFTDLAIKALSVDGK
ncbi:TetR/AcrR family transcriptional regulator [Algibacter miyuki]|uniref:TetR/AcrR family transcriptional regulator n=1 Tax=Algibacter miyuki TaxID=1306933 RepID=A0ABV5GY20_9FLAO|nr:TetR/AcrR family transcriptional regulator [Algibacter miyuki]MDN3667248.1 TetR/AcrR family transcriptional regulator [Algibacter miyuki]